MSAAWTGRNDAITSRFNAAASVMRQGRAGCTARVPHLKRIASLLAVALLFVLPAPDVLAKFEILYGFKAGSDGYWPNSNMAMDASGNLYGATANGGGSTTCSGGCGTIFRFDVNGRESILYAFSGESDGQYPIGVILDSKGNIYGTTLWGGISNCQSTGTCGVAYKFDTKGTLHVLHSFAGGSDGTNPEAALVRDSVGNLYGTTLAGGAGGGCTSNNPPGCGTVFKLDATGKETILHAFAGSDGANPSAGLLRDSAANLYGSTLNGGVNGYGTIFSLSPDGKYRVLHDFSGTASDNGYPYDGLAWDGSENLYGTTEEHPEGSSVFGTVFQLNRKTLAFTTLFAFNLSDGGYPISGLLRDGKGDLFGTTLYGGSCKRAYCGTVFELDTSGRLTTLHDFTRSKSGGFPQSIPVLDASGNLYGTALDGPNGAGIIYKITR